MLNIPGQIVSGAVYIMAVQAMALAGRKKTIKRLEEENLFASASADLLERQLVYTLHLLDKNDIKLDEFDYIALPSVRLKEVTD